MVQHQWIDLFYHEKQTALGFLFYVNHLKWNPTRVENINR